MTENICGQDCCAACAERETCPGCAATGGKPKGGECVVAACCRGRGLPTCGACRDACRLREAVIGEVNALGIPGMPKLTKLHELAGAFINLEYPLPGGQTVRFWDDSRIYLGAQLENPGEERCFGLIADENHLLVCQYGCGGADPEIILFKKR